MGEHSRPHLEAMRIVTGCTTAAQFVDVFHRFCDGKTLFIPTTELRPVGSRLAFSLRLADGSPMLRGSCTVREAWPNFSNVYRRPGVLLELEKLTSESDAIVEQLLAQQTQVTAPPAAPTSPIDDEATTPTEHRDRTLAKPTQQLRRAKVAASRPPATRVAGSPIVLPANPLTGMDDAALTAFLDCSVSGDPAAPAAHAPAEAAPLPPASNGDATQPTLTPPGREVHALQGLPARTPPAKRRAQPPPIPAAARKKSATKPFAG